MFIHSPNSTDGSRVVIIGEFQRIDGQYVILKVNNNEIKVEHKGLDNYRTKYILVSGIIQNGIVTEQYTKKVEDDFNFNNFCEFSKLNSKYPELF